MLKCMMEVTFMTEQKNTANPTGLTTAEAEERQKQFGRNELIPKKKKNLFREILKALSEPMFLLLIVTAVIYFLLGEPRDGAVMLIFVLGMISIDVVQGWKTDKTLNALKDLAAPRITVLRDGAERRIDSANLVPGDIMLIAEGDKIPADGEILQANDLCVDESSMTGEAEGVWKVALGTADTDGGHWRRDFCYAGTLVTQGSALVRVKRIGKATEFGKIGVNVAGAPEAPSPLQRQTRGLVKLCAAIAAVLFVLVGCFTWLNIPDHQFTDRLIESILSGVTLAMAMIPEEFPVILTVFLSMGAWRLAKRHSLMRRLASVETLGAVSVLCVDKTGTITTNRMTVCETWANEGKERDLCAVMGMACEPDAYDPMEKAMISYCEGRGLSRDFLFGGRLIREYSFTHEAKMMGHVWRRGNEILIAAKGSPEKILALCNLNSDERDKAQEKAAGMAARGLRVIAVGRMEVGTAGEVPASLAQCRLQFCGLVGLADPPRESVKADILRCRKAGVRVVMITGDNGITAGAIAKQIGMPCGESVTGDEIDRMTDEKLQKRVRSVSIFSRVVPEHKMRIVKAFKANGEIVAMTGDGVNDAPALKYADIGIAMGKRGSEVSREAADLILLDDNFSTIVDTIRDGRRIYDNIKKAVGYVFTIHIPIAFSCLLAPLLKVNPANLMLLPVHVVLLELIIDPTCSIIFERQPAEQNVMERDPRDPKEKLMRAKGLFRSILQGLTVFASSFGTYYTVLMADPAVNAPVARAMGLSIIFLSNILLVLVNSSQTNFAFQSFHRLIKDKVMWAAFAGTIFMLVLLLYTPLSAFVKLAPLTGPEAIAVIVMSAASVLWVEIVKLVKHLRKK
jgi:Ca2+-transporting ATPase